MIDSHIYIDQKNNRICILIEGHGWWKLPMDEDVYRALLLEYVKVKKELRGEDTVEDFILEITTT